MALAVPRASDPILKTTVLPDLRTPVASAKTFGRPSKTKPTTPRPALMRSTRHPAWSMVSAIVPRPEVMDAQSFSPSTMPARIVSESTSLVVERPRSRARSTSAALASAMGAKVAAWARRSAKAR